MQNIRNIGIDEQIFCLAISMKIISLVGARPQFIKEAILNSAARASEAWKHILVHSGQHYDISMSDIFFGELGIPKQLIILALDPEHMLKQQGPS